MVERCKLWTERSTPKVNDLTRFSGKIPYFNNNFFLRLTKLVFTARQRLTVDVISSARVVNAADDESSKSLVNVSPADLNVICLVVTASVVVAAAVVVAIVVAVVASFVAVAVVVAFTPLVAVVELTVKVLVAVAVAVAIAALVAVVEFPAGVLVAAAVVLLASVVAVVEFVVVVFDSV